MSKTRFTVDTHLFRELGELLVGRDSTALVELIKNSYDADATQVVVYGVFLDDPEKGYIVIDDDGDGMGFTDFETGFLRIASRLKERGDRISPRFGRRFTGAKGVGRLAAHKLAKVLEIKSSKRANGAGSREIMKATIDWEEIEKRETLDELPALEVTLEPADATAKSGTVITLRKLRRRWTDTQRGRFIGEVQTFEPPTVLAQPLPRTVVTEPLIFDASRLRESGNRDPGCSVRLMGDFTGGEEHWKVVAHAATWVIELDSLPGSDEVRCVIAPTPLASRNTPAAARRTFVLRHPNGRSGPSFQARILLREGAQKGSKEERAWAQATSGIRVFVEGFRVLPYGEPSNDWLNLDADYTRRARGSVLLGEGIVIDPTSDEQADRDWGLSLLPNRNYYGAVFLTQTGATSLRLLVNREGFIPDAAFEGLQKLVRAGIDLSTRVRAAANLPVREARRQQRASAARSRQSGAQLDFGLSATLKDSATRATTALREARGLLASNDPLGATSKLVEVQADIDQLSHAAQELMSEGAMLRVLASVGTQMGAFVHEIRGLVGMSAAIQDALEKLRGDRLVSALARRKVATIQTAHGELKRSLERQAAYLVEVVAPDARRRRARQLLSERLEASIRLHSARAEKRGITILNEIPVDLKSPAMFPAELTVVFSNLLSNAVKAAGEGGSIRAAGERLADGSVSITIENTGAVVDLSDAERWFRPFESTTTDQMDAVLEQGMGLGLPITRRMLEDYGAEIRFVQPSKKYSTAIKVNFPTDSHS